VTDPRHPDPLRPADTDRDWDPRVPGEPGMSDAALSGRPAPALVLALVVGIVVVVGIVWAVVRS
jgi:hypothetical protein